MFVPDPDFCPSRIQKQQQERGEKMVVLPFFVATKLNNYFIFELVKKKIWATFS
jgi:hypothetical protein